uniref:Uncharacterized protein n=1 Tax=Malurus cyaneus samueli TaxID=2593467 RepID=A0A8C5U1F7_9PASS
MVSRAALFQALSSRATRFPVSCSHSPSSSLVLVEAPGGRGRAGAARPALFVRGFQRGDEQHCSKPEQQMQTFPVCPTPSSFWCFVFLFFSPQFGIESLKKESAGSRRESSQKTLIALVTSGLLLAFLGLAGYFLMKRRSWSPAGQRLAEDPYYTESQGNTMLMTPSQEPAELQEKPNLPNLNGGTQENGTGQASSKNGHSKNSPADSEM